MSIGWSVHTPHGTGCRGWAEGNGPVVGKGASKAGRFPGSGFRKSIIRLQAGSYGKIGRFVVLSLGRLVAWSFGGFGAFRCAQRSCAVVRLFLFPEAGSDFGALIALGKKDKLYRKCDTEVT